MVSEQDRNVTEVPYSNAYLKNSAKYADNIGSLPRFLKSVMATPKEMDGKEFFEILNRKAKENVEIDYSPVRNLIQDEDPFPQKRRLAASINSLEAEAKSTTYVLF